MSTFCDRCDSLPTGELCEYCGYCRACCECDEGPTDAQLARSYDPPEVMTIFDKDTLGRGGL